MTRYLLKLGLFAASLSVMTLVIQTLAPFCWGNPFFCDKYQQVSTADVEYDAYFLGSSRVLYGFDPQTFQDDTGLRAYNFATTGGTLPESLYLFEALLASPNVDKFQGKQVYIELYHSPIFGTGDVYTARKSYFLNKANIQLIWSGALQLRTVPIYDWPAAYWPVLLTHIGNRYLAVLHLDDVLRQLTFFKERDLVVTPVQRLCGMLRPDGFLPIGEQSATNCGEAELQTYTQFQESGGERLATYTTELVQTYNSNSALPAAYEERLTRVLALADEHQVDVVFVLTPRTPAIPGLSDWLPSHTYVDVSNPTDYAMLYSLENSYDLGHLNVQGSRIFTQQFAQQLKRLGITQ